MIKAENISKHYGDFVAVKDVSFSIQKGEIVGLLGHNGAGKTTIMKMLTGFLEPTKGEVFVDDLNIADFRLEAQAKIGYLPENCPTYPEMTVVDYLSYVAELRGLPTDEIPNAVRRSIENTSLQEKSLSTIATLSRGYRQRVGVAQAILHKPEILILDEPTNGLDPSQIHDMRSLIERLAVDSTVILSTHILQEVQAVCDRVIIIRRGEIAVDAKIKDLQDSRQLFLSVNKPKEQIEPIVSKIEGIKRVSYSEQKGVEHRLTLELAKEADVGVQAAVSRAVLESGTELYALNPHRRDLETVFRENSA